MKKIVNHPRGLRLDGVVESDGVGFLPIKDAGPMSLQTSGYFATTDEEGNITSRVLNVNVRDKNEENEVTLKMEETIKSRAKTAMTAAIITIIGCLIMIFVSATWPNPAIWISVFSMITYVMLAVLLLPKACAILVGKIFRNKEMVSFSKYLGAKNAVENAYYDLGRAPSMEEVKDYSLHSTNCDYTKNSYIASLAILICFVQFLDGAWYWVGAILAIILLCTLEWKNKLTFWQALIVSKPDEVHYQVAIRAIEETEDIIDSIQVSYHEINVDADPEHFEEKKCKGCPAYDFCKNVSQELNRNDTEKTKEESDHDPAAD